MLYEEDSGDLRSIKYGQHELLSRIYVAVRDPDWNTAPARITVREMLILPDSFTIRYQAEHREGDIRFTWDGMIVGEADSRLSFAMDGVAQSTFWRNRIGFCVLHPMSCAGRLCSVEHSDGSVTTGRFPVEIAAHQPFLNIRAIAHEITDDLQVVVRFTGETFEMEDQRNWTDASYKTYGTPLDLPRPVEVTAGTHIQQSVRLELSGSSGLDWEAASNTSLQFTVTDEIVGRLPKLGLASASDGQSLTEREIERLRLLNLEHLRAEVHFGRADWGVRIEQAFDEAQRLGIALEM
ncbi:MAG: hypothetical protein ABI700_16050, partial [Chloroflexota bacterium]